MKNFFGENRTAILFIVKFVCLYLVLNTAYGFYIEFYSPQADPVTIIATQNAASILSVFHEAIQAVTDPMSPFVTLQKGFLVVVNVFEGCNGINVMIVFVSFLIAFKGSVKSTGVFFLAGLVIIYVMNLLRIVLLFEVAFYFPEQLYFFHKYFLTGIIYAVVFVIWYFWIKHVRSGERGDA